MNLVMIGLFTGTVIGIETAILQSLSRGFVSSALFLIIRVLYDRWHTRFSLSMEMSRLTRDGTAEPVSRDQILRHARGQGQCSFSLFS